VALSDELVCVQFFSRYESSLQFYLSLRIVLCLDQCLGEIKSAYDWLMKNTKTLAWLYWDTHRREVADAKAGVEPYASYLKGDDSEIPVSPFVRRPRPGAATGSMSGIEVIVLGGETNTYWFGSDFSHVTSASIDKWR